MEFCSFMIRPIRQHSTVGHSPLNVQGVTQWKEEIETYAQPETQIILVGNKTDLPAEITTQQGQVLPLTDRKDMANSLGFEFAEVSAKTADGINDVFTSLTRDIIKAAAPASGKKDGKTVNPANTPKQQKERRCTLL